MNTLKRFFALTLCLILVVLCFAGCHKKGELAATVGDVEFTSGDYACALLFADVEARQKVAEAMEEDETIVLTEEKDIYKQKIDDVEYKKWVENTTLDNLKLIAATMTLCDEAGIKMDSDKGAAKTYVDEVNAVVDDLWSVAENVTFMEENGVSKETFKKYTFYTCIHNPLFLEFVYGEGYAPILSNPLFDSIYGKDGDKAISEEELKAQLSDNYILVNRLNSNFNGVTDEVKKEEKAKFAAYEEQLNAGTKTFEEIYLEYNGQTSEEHKHEEPAEGELAPKDYHAIPISEETTDIGYGTDYYKEVKDITLGKAKVITLKDDEGIVLVVKKDILEDSFYLSQYDTDLREEIVGDELVNSIKKQANKLSCKVNTKSTKQFDIEKIYYPEVSAY